MEDTFKNTTTGRVDHVSFKYLKHTAIETNTYDPSLEITGEPSL